MIELTLYFKSEDDRDDFVAGLTDGWGEGRFYAEWEDDAYEDGVLVGPISVEPIPEEE
jgi:hypothetical protein